MFRPLFAATLASGLAVMTPAHAADVDVGVSVSIGQPGFYGRLDIGGFPPPVLLYPQPRIIHSVPASRPPIYLRVPPGHAKHWSKHCHRYQACGERVYFVQDNWYEREYAPRYQERHSHRNDYDRDYGRERQFDNRRDYRDDNRRDHRHDERRDRDERGGRGERDDRGDRGERGHERGGRH